MGHREGEDEVSPGQNLIRYSKKKGYQRQPFLNKLITIGVSPGYFAFLWYVVSLKRRRKATSENGRTADGKVGTPPVMTLKPASGS